MRCEADHYLLQGFLILASSNRVASFRFGQKLAPSPKHMNVPHEQGTSQGYLRYFCNASLAVAQCFIAKDCNRSPQRPPAPRVS